MEMYLLKFSGCLFVFWLAYVLFLEQQDRHHFKRFYLLGALVIALIIPVLTLTYYIEPVLDFGTFDPNSISTPPYFSAEIASIVAEEKNYLPIILWSIYSIGVLLFSIRFIVNLKNMYTQISQNETIQKRSFVYVLLKELRIPHSFFNYIFLNQKKYNTNAIPKEVILHEETHAKQLHSLDIMAIELLQIVFWFHPLVYVLKHHIKLNHEFLADQAVLNNGIAPKIYQNILLQFSSNTPNNQLSSAINYSSIKKRFTVMKTQTSKTKIWLSSLILLPIITILFYSFSSKKYVEKELEISPELVQSANRLDNNSEGATEKLMLEYKSFIEEYNAKQIIYANKYNRAIIIYDQLMSDEQRASVKKYPARFFPEGNLSKTTPKNPTKAQFEAYKNAEEYAIWIDGNHVLNSELDNYTLKDFVHVSGSRVFKNARSKKFPQPNQYRLYTKQGFKKTYQEAGVRKYKEATTNYSKTIKSYLQGNQSDNSELKILKSQCDKIYNSFSENELLTYNLKPAPPVPAEKTQEPPTAKQIADYNSWAKKINGETKILSEKAVWYPPIDSKNLIEFDGIYQRMTIKQKENSAKFPYDDKILKNAKLDFQKTATYSAQQDIPSTKEIIEYNAWAKKLKKETLLAQENERNNKTANYPIIKQKDLIKYVGIYKRMTTEQKQSSAELPLADDELKTTGLKFPPPPPPSSTQQDIPTGKQVAEYNTWAKKITSQINKAEKEKSNEYPIIKLKDLNRFKSIYNRMSMEQKENAKPFPNISKIPIIKPHPGYKKRPNTNDIPKSKQVTEYNTWAKKTKEKYKTLPESHKIEGFPIMDKKVFNYYNSIYKRMSAQQLKNAESFPEAAIAPPPPPPPSHKGKVSKSMVNIYNQWIKGLKNTDGTYNIITKEDYTYYISIYNNMTEEQKKNSAGLPPPPPPPSTPKSKQNKEEEREIPPPPPPPIPENVSPEERARMINVTEAYAKKHPESVTKAKIGGKIVDVVEMPMDDEGTTEIFGKKYKYIIKDGITTYFDSKNKKYTEDEFKKHIRTIEDNLKETKRSKNDKGGPNANNSEYIYTGKAPERIPSSDSKDLIIRKLIIKMSKNQTKPMLYKLNNYNSSASEIKKYLEKNQQANVSLIEGKENVLHFYDKMGSKMSEGELQNIYSAIFKTYSEKDKKKIYYHKAD